MSFILFYISKMELIPLIAFLNLSFILFFIGLVGIIWNKKSLLIMLVCMELMFFSISLNFIFLSFFTHNIVGQTLALLIVTTVASESAIGLSLLVVSYRLGDKISYNSLISLRG